MLKLIVPKALEQEFATVEALWHATGETGRVDALLLSWVKYEKQLWRLFASLFISILCLLIRRSIMHSTRNVHPRYQSARSDSHSGARR